MLYTRTKESGVTLLEVLLYISIVSVLVGVLAVTIVDLREAYARSRVIHTVSSAGDGALHELTALIRNAESVTKPGVGAASSELRVTDRTGQTVTVTVSNGQLQWQGAGSTYALTPERLTVVSVAFERLSAADASAALRIELTLRRGGREGTTYEYTSTHTGAAVLRGE